MKVRSDDVFDEWCKNAMLYFVSQINFCKPKDRREKFSKIINQIANITTYDDLWFYNMEFQRVYKFDECKFDK